MLFPFMQVNKFLSTDLVAEGDGEGDADWLGVEEATADGNVVGVGVAEGVAEIVGGPKYCLITIGTYPTSKPGGGVTIIPESKEAKLPVLGPLMS